METADRIRVLFVEDVPSDAELAERELRKSGMAFDSVLVDTKDSFLSELANFRPDIIVSDYSMPAFDGMTALKLARDRDPLMPFVILTGAINEMTAVACMKAGADDYLIKEHLTRLPFAVSEAVEKRRKREVQDAMDKENRTLRERLEHYLSTSPTITYSISLCCGEAKIDWISENVEQILGYRSAEALVPDWWFQNLHPADRKRAVSGVSRWFGKEARSMEYRFRKKDMTYVWLQDKTSAVRDSSGGVSEIIGTLTDITEKKEMERASSLKSTALETAANSIAIFDRDGSVLWANESFYRMTALSPEVVSTKTMSDLVNARSSDPDAWRELWRTVSSGFPWHGQTRNARPDGSSYVAEQTITPVPDETGRVEYFVSIQQDVTERIQTAEQLEASLREKDELLKEIHHRVKNNMQIVISLLNLEAQNFPETSFHSAMVGIISRIQAMSLVHEQFYSSDNKSEIDFSLFISRYIENINGGNFADGAYCESCAADEPLFMNLEKAIPCGLILNELVMAAEKPMTIDLRKENSSSAVLTVSNRPSSRNTSEPLNISLLDALVAQVGGSYQFYGEGKESTIVRIPI